MRKKILLFGITLAAMLSSCYGPNDSVYTEDLDVVLSKKKDNYDFTTKSKFYVSDTIIYIDADGELHKSPNEDGKYDHIPKQAVDAIVGNVIENMKDYGWSYISSPDDVEKDKDISVLMDITISKTKYVGGGYYPIYPGWGWGYPGWGYWDPWVPYYYSYSTASVDVSMLEVTDEDKLALIWDSFLSGYARNGIDVQYINNGIDIGFEQSDYLNKKK